MSDRSWMTSVTFLRGRRAISLLPLLLIGLLVLFVPTNTTGAFLKISAQQSDDIRPLKAGDTIQRALAAGESHLYQSRLESGQYLELSIQQRGIGLVVTLIGPDGAAANQIIVPNGQYVLMTLSLITKSAGDYKLEIAPEKGTTAAGKYELKADAIRAATPQDGDRISANQLMNEARLLAVLQKSADAIPKIIEKYERSLALWKSLGDAAGEATALGEVAGYYDGPGQAQKALDAHTRALALWRNLGRDKEEAGELCELGLIAYTRNDSQKALEYYQQALSIHQSVNDPFGTAETLNRMGWLYRSLGEPHQAMEYFGRALPLRREASDWMGESITLNDLGRVSDELGEPQRALDFYGQALALRPPEKDPSGAGVILSRLAIIYDRAGDKQKALDVYAKAIQLLRQIGDRRAEAAALNNLGVVYAGLSEWEQALDCYEQAIKLCREMGLRNGEAAVLSHIGSAHVALGALQKAMEYHQQALALRQAVADRSGQADSLSDLGYDSYIAGDNQKAMEYYAPALALYQAVGNREGEARALARLGSMYRALGERQKALEYLNQALPIQRAVVSRRGEADTLRLLALTWAELGDLEKAKALLEEALKIVESQRSNVISQELRVSYFATAQMYFESYIDLLMKTHERHPGEGYDAIALQASERMRARNLLELLEEARIDIRQGVDSTLLEKERSLRQRLDARATAQTRLLNGKHSEAQAADIAKELAGLTSQYQDLQTQIRASSPRYSALTKPQPLTVTEIQTQILDDQTLLLEYVLGEKRSFLWAVSRTSIASYSLPPRAEIESAALKVYELLTVRQLQPGLSEARHRERLLKAEAEYPAQMTTLSRMLLAPVAAELGAKRLLIVASGALEYLPFAALPSPATGGQGDKETGRQGNKETRVGERSAIRNPQSAIRNPLIASHEIINLPSASVLSALRRETAGRPTAPKTVAALADPVFEPADPRVEVAVQGAKKTPLPTKQPPAAQPPAAQPPAAQPPAIKDTPSSSVSAGTDLARAVRDFPTGSGLGLLRLPFSREEAEAILSLAPGESGMKALNFQASRATATSSDLSQYRIVHFATHGLLNSEHPELSGLVFSLIDEHGQPQNGFLRLHEIYNLRLPAELVVLSACQSGLGKQIKGEGLVGLTRGFMYAGAPRVVASLWRVNDLATAELMKRFYRGMLKDGLRPAAALRAAQIEMLNQKQWSSPYFWAAFVLQGEWK